MPKSAPRGMYPGLTAEEMDAVLRGEDVPGVERIEVPFGGLWPRIKRLWRPAPVYCRVDGERLIPMEWRSSGRYDEHTGAYTEYVQVGIGCPRLERKEQAYVRPEYYSHTVWIHRAEWRRTTRHA